MLLLEHNRRQQFDQLYDLEQSIQAPFPGLTMDMYDSAEALNNFHPLPYSFFENPSMFATAPMHSIKQEMHQFHDLPPALISSGSAASIPSASSSTVGSPYSGPAHMIPSQDGYDHAAASYGLGVMPAIVNHETFSQDILGTAMEAELSLASHEKLPDSFVGECADLSSSQTPPTRVAPPNARSVQPLSSSSHAQCLPFTASPQSLSINTFFDPRVPTAPSIASSSVLSTATHSPATDHTRATPIFKSPTTPASACSRRSSVVSPVNARGFPSAARSQTNYASHAHMFPHLSANFAPQQHHAGHFQSHFFAQSSGNFIPPLESSCSSLPPVFPMPYELCP
jgi:hypothetical protein